MSFIKEGVPLVETVKQPIVELTNHQDATTPHHFTFLHPSPPAIYNRSAETTTRSCGEREHMFEKVVTPSDVGKLNRLVIPKQHAEKYFPLDSSSPENGKRSLLLNFEDSSGKPWRFRYSYWSSSQSYVITKGWSRFVKEKKLGAGDVVSFDREISHCVRFFIDWRRRANMGMVQLRPVPWGRVFFSPTSCYTKFNYSCNYHVFNPALLRYDPFGQAIASSTGGGDRSAVVFESVPVVPRRTVGKRVRLFGVNLDCPSEEEGEGCSSAIVPAMAHEPYPSTSMQLISRDLQRRSKLSLSLDLDV